MALPTNYSTKELNSRETVQEFLNNTDNFLLDCDGVLWRGTQLLPHIAETLEMLKKMGKKIFYVTNNSSKSRKTYAEKFRKMGIPAEESEILSSSFGAAEYLKNTGFNKKVYVIGCEGIYQEMEQAGIQCFKDEKGNIFPHNETKFTEEFFASPQFKLDPEIGAVVVGYDNHFNNFKLTYALMCLKKIPGCKFIATNTDPSLPYASGIELPGAGSFVFSLRACSEIEPLVIGKPETNLLDTVVTEQNLKRERTVMIGDRLETDVLMGNRGHVQSCAVLTGIAQRSHVEQLNGQQNGSSTTTAATEVASPTTSIVNYTQDMKPRFLLSSFGDIYTLLKE